MKEEPINLSFEYSKALEKERIINTIKRFPWYREQGYNINQMDLPEKLDKENLAGVSDGDLEKAIDAEFDEKKFADSEKSLTELFPRYRDNLISFLRETKLSPIPSISVQLTMYGSGGSYKPPHKVIVNISKYYGTGLLRNMLHEIIHLHIQYFIDEYKLGQWQKERIVDLLMERFVPKLSKQQQMPMDTKKLMKYSIPTIRMCRT